jgi:hypothetical protein
MNDGWNVVKPGDCVVVASRTINASGKIAVEEGIFEGLRKLNDKNLPGFRKKNYGFVVKFAHIPAEGRGLDKDGVLTLPFHMYEINPTVRYLGEQNIRPRFRFVRRLGKIATSQPA